MLMLVTAIIYLLKAVVLVMLYTICSLFNVIANVDQGNYAENCEDTTEGLRGY